MHDDPAPALRAIRPAGRWLPLAVRSSAPELLDSGALPPDELRRNLADLARLNRLPGGTGASVRAVRRLARERREIRVLDVGTGGGDVPLAFAREGWGVVAVEPDPAVARIARERVAATPAEVVIVEADGRALPFADRELDVAHASLLLHHLAPADAVALLREMGRVARLGVVLNDLRRGVLPLLASAPAVAVLGTCRTTRHDGLLSVRRAYRLDELDELLHAAGLHPVARTARWMPRVVTTAVAAAGR